MEGRNELFLKLKPPCVALGQEALALSGSRGNVQSATAELGRLRGILSASTSTPHTALDTKLAEYVFFPIAQLLKASQKLSIRCLELCLQCIAVLIDKGWKQDIQPSLAAQLLILCSLLAEKNPKGLSFSENTDELQAWSFWCMCHLFSVVSANTETAKLLRSEANFPQLGQTISVILEGIHNGGSIEAQVAATNALIALVENVTDTEVQASFLPGIVSKLTKVLTPQTNSRRNHTVLVGCLKVLQFVLRNTMGDTISSQSHGDDTNDHASGNIDAKWQESAATQLKPALSNILRLKSHSRDDVKESVASLCLVVLQHCRKTLHNCSQMMLETLLTLSTGGAESGVTLELMTLMRLDSSITVLLQNQLYYWLQSVPTVMQGSDDQAKAAKLAQIMRGYGLLKDTETNLDTIDRMLANALRDCVVVTIATPGSKLEPSTRSSPIQSLDVQVAKGDRRTFEFSMSLVKSRGQEELLSHVGKLTKLAASSNGMSSFAGDLVRQLQQSNGEAQIANFWLALTAVQNLLYHKSSIDDLLNIEDDSHATLNEYLEEIYSLSLAILSDSSTEHQDPRLQSLALRGLALRAQEARQDFRYELVDALYPVLHTLATPDVQLQRDSIAALNVFSTACGFTSVRALIVENVDYLTNAVALKLNAFDVSPQAPQVLLMMVRLAGPSLLPYLEDTVESIFAALENYHGYPLLVELLFQVLSVIAEEGTRTPHLKITEAGDDSTLDDLNKWKPTDIRALSNSLLLRAEQTIKERSSKANSPQKHPQVPWKEIDKIEDYEEAAKADGSEKSDVEIEDTETLPPAPKIYNILLKIDELTQHFLPSSSASLRSRLLNLIRKTVPAMAMHENSFLPLINTLWPEIVSRLEDKERYVVASALDVIGMLCQHAGDFMRTRVTQIWPKLKEIYHDLANEILESVLPGKMNSHTPRLESKALVTTGHLRQAVQRMHSSPSTYGDTSARLLWSSLLKTIATLVHYTRMSPEMFDEALDMAEPVLGDIEIRAAFERENPDAVWLCEIKRGVIAKPIVPSLPSQVDWKFAEVTS